MNARRERAKTHERPINKQLQTQQERPKEKDELSFEIGKFLLDLAKLTFAGVFLTGLMGMSVDMMYVVLVGAIAIGILALVGFKYIKRGINK